MGLKVIFFSTFWVFYINFKAGQCLATVKNKQESEILSYLQATKLACHIFIGACRSHEALGSETVLTGYQTARASCSHWFSLSQSLMGVMWMKPGEFWFCVPTEELWAKGPQILHSLLQANLPDICPRGWQQIKLPFAPEGTLSLSLSSNVVTYTNFPEKLVQNKRAINASAHETFRNTRPTGNCLPAVRSPCNREKVFSGLFFPCALKRKNDNESHNTC